MRPLLKESFFFFLIFVLFVFQQCLPKYCDTIGKPSGAGSEREFNTNSSFGKNVELYTKMNFI